jgi:PKD repeat protein
MLLALAGYAQVYERVVSEDAFGDDRTAQPDVVQNGGTGNLYLKGIAAGSGIRESFIKLSLEDLDELTPDKVDFAKVELRLYTVRSNVDAAQNQISVYPVANDWSETTLTWTNSRTLSSDGIAAGVIATGAGKRIAGYSGTGQQGQPTDAYNEANESRFDISAYAIQQYKLGNKTISVMLRVTNTVNNGDQQLASKDVATDVPGYELKLPKVIVTDKKPDFTAPAFGFVGKGIAFTNTSLNCDTYSWDFGDNSGAVADENPVHIYTVAGTYTVTLTAHGETKTKSIIIYGYNVETLLGSNMEAADKDAWGIVGETTFANGGAVWGATDIAGFGNGGYLGLTEENGTGTQYYIWQAVELESGSRYDLTFDYAVGTHLKAWCEVYIGQVAPVTADYTDGRRGTNPLSWTDSANQDGGNEAKQYAFSFTPEEDGIYFFVIKTGTNGNGKFHVAIDNVKLTKIVDPVADFTVPGASVLVETPIQFTNTSVNAVTYAWDFGDGGTSTDASPSHVYTATGVYQVSLTVTGNGGITDTKTIEMKALEVQDKMLAGSDMEEADKAVWGIVGESNFAVAEWGAIGIAGLGNDGYLSIGDVNTSGTKQYILWQAVRLDAGSRYNISFDYAIGEVNAAWFNLFIGTVPVTGTDYSNGQLLEGIEGKGLWNAANHNNVPGQVTTEYTCNETAIYYFVIKVGSNNGGKLHIAFDNIKLEEVPVLTEVSVENIDITEEEDAPIVASFTDQFGQPIAAVITGVTSQPATGLLIEDREGIYYVTGLVAGQYTITVTAQAGTVSRTGEATVVVTAGGAGIESPTDGLSFRLVKDVLLFSETVNAVNLYSLEGRIIAAESNTDMLHLAAFAKGVYVLQVTDAQGLQSVHKIIVR